MGRANHAPPEQGLLFGAPPPPYKPPPEARVVYRSDDGTPAPCPCHGCGEARAVIYGRVTVEPGRFVDHCATCTVRAVRRQIALGLDVPPGFEWVHDAPPL